MQCIHILKIIRKNKNESKENKLNGVMQIMLISARNCSINIFGDFSPMKGPATTRSGPWSVEPRTGPYKIGPKYFEQLKGRLDVDRL